MTIFLAGLIPPEMTIRLPGPLRHGDGFPVLGLLPGLRRHEAAPEGSNLLGDLAFPIMQRIETGLGRQLIP
jgi:hypothetical protein